jgi:hypothetical protein
MSGRHVFVNGGTSLHSRFLLLQEAWQSRLDGPFDYSWTVGPDPNGSGRQVLSMTRTGDERRDAAGWSNG